MTIRWSSSLFPNLVNEEDFTFQNALYTLRFSPKNNDLFTSLETATTEVIRGEAAILDASGSFVSNLPASIRQRDLTFSWVCSESIKDLCSTTTGSILAIEWEKVIDSNVTFGYPYEFEVVITWTK